MRESAAGPIGTGMLLGMLGFAIVWLAEVPFGSWRCGGNAATASPTRATSASVLRLLGLGGEFLFVSFALLVAMGLARLTRRWWWALAAPAVRRRSPCSPPSSASTWSPKPSRCANPATVADVRSLARDEGIPGTKAEVQDVHRFTTAPNAESVGFGSTRRRDPLGHAARRPLQPSRSARRRSPTSSATRPPPHSSSGSAGCCSS